MKQKNVIKKYWYDLNINIIVNINCLIKQIQLNEFNCLKAVVKF